MQPEQEPGTSPARALPYQANAWVNRWRRGTDGPWTYRLAAGARAGDSFDTVVGQHGWYDFTVTCSTDSSWTRRVVGHIETGRASITG